MFDFLPSWLLKPLLALVQKWDWLSAKVNAYAINAAVNAAPHRPFAFSTFSDYTCWTSLTDQTWSARHLPAAYPQNLPDPAEVVAIFQRPDGAQKLCPKSTCLFPAFAQYLTDGFIRTVMNKSNEPFSMRRRNNSNHQIDLCSLYGRTEEQVAALRLNSSEQGERGLLKSQIINGEEYSPFLLDDSGTAIRDEFKCLDIPLGLNDITDPEKRKRLFATGGDRVNAAPQIAMVNTLFLREHNRLAGEIEKSNPTWDDNRVFETARNIVIVVFIKIVVEEYINHIAPIPFHLRADPAVAWNAPWNKPNWITTEFSLLYRWHSLIPDTMVWGGKPYPVAETIQNNALLIDTGLAQSFIDTSSTRAGKLGALNTAQAILSVEFNAIVQDRVCNVAPYVAYRKYMSLTVPQKFEDISTDPAVVSELKRVYRSVGDIDFYAGIFAEDTVANSPLPELILRMVAVDAFSQALTNPLLSEHVFNEWTFTKMGWDTIQATSTLRDILMRNCTGVGSAHISMTQSGWKYR